MVSNQNIAANFEQIMADFYRDHGKVAPPDTTIVSWLPLLSRHGSHPGSVRADSRRVASVFTSPMSFLAAAGSVDADAGREPSTH